MSLLVLMYRPVHVRVRVRVCVCVELVVRWHRSSSLECCKRDWVNDDDVWREELWAAAAAAGPVQGLALQVDQLHQGLSETLVYAPQRTSLLLPVCLSLCLSICLCVCI